MKITKIFLAALSFLLVAPLLNGLCDEYNRRIRPAESVPMESDPIFTMIREGLTSQAKERIKLNPGILHYNDWNGLTPLMVASINANEELVSSMLEWPYVKEVINLVVYNGQGSALCQTAGRLSQESDQAKKARYRNVIISLLGAGADATMCGLSAQKIINDIKQEIKSVASEVVAEKIGGGAIPHSTINEYMFGQTSEQRAADEKWEAARQEGIRKAAEKSVAKNTPKSSASSSTSSGVKSLDE